MVTASTTTTLSISPTSVAAGSPVTLGATVTASDGSAPTGTVEFDAGNVALATASLTAGTSSSTASVTTSAIPAGTYQVTAHYNPQGSVLWNGSTSGVTELDVSSTSLATTNLGFTESTQTIDQGQTVTFTTTLSTAPGEPAPTGIVRYSAGPDVNHTTTIGQATITNGVATLPVGGWSGGTYVVVANYDSDGVYASTSAGPLTLTVNAVSAAVQTDTTLTLEPSTIVAGQTVTLSAHVVQHGSTLTPPGGPIVSFAGGPYVAGDPLSNSSLWVKVGDPGQVMLDANGDASEPAGGWNPGQYTLVAQYPGDIIDGYAPSFGIATLTVLPVGGGGTETLTYTGDVTDTWHNSATLSGRLTDASGDPVAGQSVTFSLGGDSCTASTDGNGNVSCQTTVNTLPGAATVIGSFPGGSTSQSFVVTARPTLTTAANVSAQAGSTASLSATLTDQATSAPLVGEAVTLGVGSDTCTATTNGSGVATCGVPASEGIGPHGITASFGGDSGYAASSGSATLTISQIPTTTTYTGATQSVQGGSATLSAHVADAPDGAAVAFTVGGESCNGTIAGGNASCTVTISDAPGTGYTVKATYAGDAAHGGSSDSKPFTVVSATTTTHIASISPVLAGSSVTLSATVSPSSAPGTVTFSSGATTLCTATLSSGSASCTASFAQSGTYTVNATYGGGGGYPASSDSTTALVYAYAPGGGSFVVGDKTATGSVTFWGAQWSKVNVLSGGPAPAAFKGFAISPSVPQCSATWTTDPGNSSSPPAGPLPAYMAVIVTSNTASNGPAIYGNTVAIVIVQTNPGYKNDPGHAGTGTVVATLCSGGSPGLPKPPSDISYTGATQGATGSTATLSAKLTDSNGKALNNKTVTLTLGSQSCTDTTDGGGNASCTVTISQPAGSYPATATFAGDGSYAGSTDSATFTVTGGGGGISCSAKGTHCESLLADPSPAAGATVTPGQTMTIVYMDESQISKTNPPTAVLSNGQSLPVVVSPTSGQPQNYVDHNGGSTSTKSQSLLTFALPAGLASGSYTVTVTAYDAEGDIDQWSWPIVVGGSGSGNGGGGDDQHGGYKNTSCGGGFNGSSVHHGNTLWFSSVLKVGGLPANGATITFTDQTITIGGKTISVPDSRVVFSRTARQATTTFEDGVWVTVVPVGINGNVFLSGIGYQVGSDIGGGQNVNWSGNMSSDTPGLTVNWQWSAAAYTSFGSSPSDVGVKPVDDNHASSWQDSNHAGTPESWGSHVTDGGTGGGGSNYTGSLSGTCSVNF